MVSVYSQVNQTKQMSEWGHCCDHSLSWSTWIGLTWEAGFIPAWFTQIYWFNWMTDPWSWTRVKQLPWVMDGNRSEWIYGCWRGKVFELWEHCLMSSMGSGVLPDSCCFLLGFCNKLSFGWSFRRWPQSLEDGYSVLYLYFTGVGFKGVAYTPWMWQIYL